FVSHQKLAPKENISHFFDLDFHFVQFKVKINESFRLKKMKNINNFPFYKKVCVCPMKRKAKVRMCNLG
ncbi:MAG: hypothetical protein JXR36_09455, partial [Bacteroidales bacterium]|nr:hypothetical protein [Bacteroidales bacterium]